MPWNELGFSRVVKPEPAESREPEMKRILGNNNIYDYYPGGKKNPLKKITSLKRQVTRN